MTDDFGESRASLEPLNIRQAEKSFHIISATRLGDLLHLWQLFKALGNNYFAQFAHILGNF